MTQDSLFLTIGLFVVGTAASVFSPDIRRVLVNGWVSFVAWRTGNYNKAIDARIVLLEELSTNVTKMQAWFWADLFWAMLLVGLLTFCVILVFAKVAVIFAAAGIVVFWFSFILVIANALETSRNIIHPSAAIERLRNRKKPQRTEVRQEQ